MNTEARTIGAAAAILGLCSAVQVTAIGQMSNVWTLLAKGVEFHQVDHLLHLQSFTPHAAAVGAVMLAAAVIVAPGPDAPLRSPDRILGSAMWIATLTAHAATLWFVASMVRITAENWR